MTLPPTLCIAVQHVSAVRIRHLQTVGEHNQTLPDPGMSVLLRGQNPTHTAYSLLARQPALPLPNRSTAMPKTFAKRTFTMPLLARSFATLVLYTPIRWIALVKPATSRALREKVILGVTSVNDCRWCSWLHSGIALTHGVDLDELQSLLDSGTFGAVDEREATAVLFGQHFAETFRRPTPEARRALARQFTPWQRLEIMAWIHFIYFCNLAGNSADAAACYGA